MKTVPLLPTVASTLAIAALITMAASAHATDGLVGVRSPYSAKETMDRLETIAKERGQTIFARVDHAAGAAKVGKVIRPTEVLIFGSPAGGTPFLECAQSVGIDLPLKALVWEDASKQVWLGYNDPTYLAQRHEIPKCAAAEPVRKTLAGLADAAVATGTTTNAK